MPVLLPAQGWSCWTMTKRGGILLAMVATQNIWVYQSPWKLYVEFRFGSGVYIYGLSETECLKEATKMQPDYGDITVLMYITDDYYTDGQRLGRKREE